MGVFADLFYISERTERLILQKNHISESTFIELCRIFTSKFLIRF